MANEVKTAGAETTYRSERQKTSDRAGMTGGSNSGSIGKRDLSDKASDMADDVAHKARDAGDKLKDKASDVGDSMQEKGNDIAEKSKNAHKVICDFTKENPTAAILLAFGIGAILARVLPGR